MCIRDRRWRDQLARGMAQPGEQVRQINWVLALMPYTRPGALKVSHPLQSLPDWLLGDYVAYCAPELEEQLNQPAGLLKAGVDAPEPLTQRRGEEAMAWFRDAEVLVRMRALIRQYRQTPLDQETLEELCGLRRKFPGADDVNGLLEATISNVIVQQVQRDGLGQLLLVRQFLERDRQ